MTINNINNLASHRLQSSSQNQGASVNHGPAQSTQNSVRSADSVSLTSEAQQLQKLQQQINSAPTGNEHKVAQLKKAVANGEYQVNSEAVAKKMIGLEKQLDKFLG